MGIENPQTYGEFYWSKQVEAEKYYNDQIEKNLAPSVAGLISSLRIVDSLPEGVAGFINTMTHPSSFAWGAVLARFGSEVADSVVSQTLGAALQDFSYLMAEKFHDKRIDPATACILYQRKSITETLWAARMLSGGYELGEGSIAYGASLPYPSIPDIVRFARYQGNPDNIRAEVWEWFDVQPDEFPIWEFMTQQRLSTEQAISLFKRKIYSEGDLTNELAQLGWTPADRGYVKELGYDIPNAMLLVQSGLLRGQSLDMIANDVQIAGIHPQYTQRYIDAVLTKPAVEDIIRYQLRKDPSLGALIYELTKIGVHPEYGELYRELAQIIPPVGDIITMAVREAFSPAVASRFGQYEDFPEDFAKYAAMSGLSKEWAERYWAAHWSLPSPQQGFEMLHRGVISEDELNLLLRALDIMPFWRDKLIKISFNPLTRIDVRRMFSVGVLNEGEVRECYKNIGYNERDATLLTEFTVKQTLQTQSKFSSTDVIKAYADRKISESEARSILSDLNIRSNDISNIIRQADYKREWEFVDTKTKAVRNLYKRGVLSENDVRRELSDSKLPNDQIDMLLKQWYYEEKAISPKLWTTAQTLSFVSSNLITRDRAKQELKKLGYDDEHITVYLAASVKPSE